MFIRPINLAFFCCALSFTAMSVEPAYELKTASMNTDILNAHYAFYQGDSGPAEQLISYQSKHVGANNESLALQQLQVMLWVEQEEDDKATELLLHLQNQHSTNADISFFAAGI